MSFPEQRSLEVGEYIRPRDLFSLIPDGLARHMVNFKDLFDKDEREPSLGDLGKSLEFTYHPRYHQSHGKKTFHPVSPILDAIYMVAAGVATGHLGASTNPEVKSEVTRGLIEAARIYTSSAFKTVKWTEPEDLFLRNRDLVRRTYVAIRPVRLEAVYDPENHRFAVAWHEYNPTKLHQFDPKPYSLVAQIWNRVINHKGEGSLQVGFSVERRMWEKESNGRVRYQSGTGIRLFHQVSEYTQQIMIANGQLIDCFVLQNALLRRLNLDFLQRPSKGTETQ